MYQISCQSGECTKLNPYITNWIISFVSNRKQRVVVDGFTTNYSRINRGIPYQGTVLGSILSSLMVNDICAADEKNNLLVKFRDDITVTVPVRNGKDCLFRGKQHERLAQKELHESQPAKELGDGHSRQNIKAQTTTIARYQKEGISQTTWCILPEQAYFVEHKHR